MKHALRYLQGIMDFGLRYVRVGGEELQGYIDSDWVESVVDRKSMSRCCFTMGSTRRLWYNMNQQSTILSSIEEKYMAANMASCEAVWLRKMFARLFDLEISQQ